MLNTAGKGRDHAYGPPLVVPERVVRLIGRDAGFAALVAFIGVQAPRSARTGQLAAAAELPEVQVRVGYPAPPFGPPVREGSRRAEVGHAAGAGQLIDIGEKGVDATVIMGPELTKRAKLLFSLDTTARPRRLAHACARRLRSDRLTGWGGSLRARG